MKNISDSEWKVMEVAWDMSPVLASEIVQALIDDTNWNPKTIHTLIRRLVAKGALKAKKEKTYYLYSASISQSECIKKESTTFIQKYFKGSFHMMITNFINDEDLSEKDIDELQKLLDSKRGK